ncbi:MAG: WGR domain-containing protein [Planctomycetales bacterium]|nr:WGR domain-containing protein [Planctomycetales bacterium]
MDNLLTIALEAHNPERNHHRRYEITVGRDLFGAWTVGVRYGRVGRGGQELRYGAEHAAAMQKIVRERLKDRQSAPRRIDCRYRLVRCEVAPEMDAYEWLPADLREAFDGEVGKTAG